MSFGSHMTQRHWAYLCDVGDVTAEKKHARDTVHLHVTLGAGTAETIQLVVVGGVGKLQLHGVDAAQTTAAGQADVVQCLQRLLLPRVADQ